ncbi:MAG: HAMP domain-containing histidine kinase [Deltaproteobacteria bacterium]|nr:HAMP domain-containing histidine kinase [Deltaproteobacteria bacterium]
MLTFLRQLHNRRPLLWTVVAFIMVIALATTMSIWWNYLLIQNHRILEKMTAAAENNQSSIPLAILMIFGLASSLLIVLGLLYMFLRLIRAIQLNLAQSQFISAVTHELRSPVASLQLMLDTIRDPSTPPERRREFEQCMHTDLLRLRGLVDQVLDTARLENFISMASREIISVSKILHTCAEALDMRIKMASGVLNVPQVPPELVVNANPRLLTTVITNVLDNALKYSQGSAAITMSVTDTGGSVLIDIQDKGIGISRSEQKRVFKRFYRARDPLSRDLPGTGLGLYFARLAIRAQGGNISIHSDGRGLGTTVRIEVPKR